MLFRVLWKYENKQIFCGHSILRGVFVTQLSSSAGISVSWIFWVMTDCCFFEKCASPAARLALNFTCTLYLRVSYELYIVHMMVFSQGDRLCSQRERNWSLILHCIMSPNFSPQSLEICHRQIRNLHYLDVTALQAGRSRVRFPMVSLELSIE